MRLASSMSPAGTTPTWICAGELSLCKAQESYPARWCKRGKRSTRRTRRAKTETRSTRITWRTWGIRSTQNQFQSNSKRHQYWKSLNRTKFGSKEWESRGLENKMIFGINRYQTKNKGCCLVMCMVRRDLKKNNEFWMVWFDFVLWFGFCVFWFWFVFLFSTITLLLQISPS